MSLPELYELWKVIKIENFGFPDLDNIYKTIY